MNEEKAKAPSKSTFIRQYPDLTADEIVAKAKEAGIEMKKHSVHQLRSADKARARDKPKARKGKEPPPRGAAKAFILSCPMDMSIADVQKKAKKAGLNPPHQVYINSVRKAHRETLPKRGRPRKEEPGTALAKAPRNALAATPVVQGIRSRGLQASELQTIIGDDIDGDMKSALKIGIRLKIANLTHLLRDIEQM